MPQYAYRALAPDQSAIRVALEADTPSEVVRRARDAGHHVVMLYRMESQPQPRFVALMELPNWPLPSTLSGRVARRCGLPVRGDFRSLWRAFNHDGPAVKARQLRRLREYVTGPSDISFPGEQPQIPTSPPPDLEEIERNKLESFLKARRVQCDESFFPDENALKLVSKSLASVYQIVPYAVEGNTLICICSDFTNPHTADDIKFMLNMNAEYVRCAETPEENERKIKWLMKRLYSHGDETPITLAETVHLTEVESRRPATLLKPWEDRILLPPLPNINRLELSRIEYVLAQSAALDQSNNPFCNPIAKLAHLILMTTVRKGFDGLRIWRDEVASHFEYADSMGWQHVDSPPMRLHEPIVLCVATAAGIDPENLAPAHSEITWSLGETALAVTAATEFTDYGERLEIHWRSA
jgi:hypothetical protein